MKNLFDILENNALFENIYEDKLETLLNCLDTTQKSYDKNEFIILTESNISSVGIMVDGNAQIIREDILGNKTILTELIVGDLFAETFVCAGIRKSPVSILALTKCEVLYIDYQQIISTCASKCDFHTKLIENMLKVIAQKNILLNAKIEVLSQRTTREKLMSYFVQQMQKAEANIFYIPFSRDELSDYLSVNRSALSRELCKMRDEGILNFRKNKFEIL